ncbi:MAG: uL22 family ribosomal protein [Candidatus Aenigmatarchaeota archaeon]
MLRYALNLNPKKSAKAYGRALEISTKNATILCRKISGMNIVKGKKLLEDLIEMKRDINGKYYTKTAKEILNVVKSAEANAEYKGLDTNRLIIYASAHKGFTFYRPRRVKLRGRKKKITHVQIVLLQK